MADPKRPDQLEAAIARQTLEDLKAPMATAVKNLGTVLKNYIAAAGEFPEHITVIMSAGGEHRDGATYNIGPCDSRICATVDVTCSLGVLTNPETQVLGLDREADPEHNHPEGAVDSACPACQADFAKDNTQPPTTTKH